MQSNSITVILVTYNGEEKDIIATIRSIINQKDINVNLIIADDGSKNFDSSFYKDYLTTNNYKRFEIIESKINRGTVINIFNALSHVKTKYVKLIGQGDLLYDEHTLNKAVNFMEKGNYKVAFGKLCGYYPDDLNKNCVYCSPIDITGYLKNNTKMIRNEFIYYLNGPCGASRLYDADTLYKYIKILKNKVKYCEDNDLAIIFLDGIDIGYYKDYFVWYQVGTGISSCNNSESVNRMRKDQYQFYKLLYEIRPCKTTKTAWNIYKTNLIKNELKRKISKILSNPQIILFKIKCFFNRNKTIRELNINDENRDFLLKCFE